MKLITVLSFCALICACASKTQPGWTTGQGVSAPDDSLSSTNCPTTNVWRHDPGSWVISSPQIHMIFWGNWWITNTTGSAEYLSETQTWNILGADPNFYAPVQEYGVGQGQLAGTFFSYWEVPTGNLAESDIQKELTNEIQSGALPSPDNQSIYVVMLPVDTLSQYDIDNNFSGHHSYLNDATYAVIENNSNSDFTISHEIYESSTNPDTSNGWWGPGGETEVADLCQSHATKLDGYTITTVWSEQQCKCIP
jgi:hypothetical protein